MDTTSKNIGVLFREARRAKLSRIPIDSSKASTKRNFGGDKWQGRSNHKGHQEDPNPIKSATSSHWRLDQMSQPPGERAKRQKINRLWAHPWEEWNQSCFDFAVSNNMKETLMLPCCRIFEHTWWRESPFNLIDDAFFVPRWSRSQFVVVSRPSIHGMNNWKWLSKLMPCLHRLLAF